MAACRRKLFERGEPEHPLTPLTLSRLRVVAELQPLTVFQLADVVGCSERAARDALRILFHHGLVARAGVPRAALAEPDEPNDASLLWGRAPTVYTLTREGLHMLAATGKCGRDGYVVPERYGPKNWLFLAHELGVRDVRGWLARIGRTYPAHPGLLSWAMGKAAWVEMGARQQVRPDACFAYRLPGGNTLFRFVEVDRGTERSPARWEDKFHRYMALLPDKEQMREATGYEMGRVLVLTPHVQRREQLWEWLSGWTSGQQGAADRFWIAERAVLIGTNLSAQAWRVAGRDGPLPLVSLALL